MYLSVCSVGPISLKWLTLTSNIKLLQRAPVDYIHNSEITTTLLVMKYIKWNLYLNGMFFKSIYHSSQHRKSAFLTSAYIIIE